MNKLATLALFAVAASSQAAVYDFASLEQGWYDEFGTHITFNNNTLTGRDEAGTNYHSFFAFDLSSIPANEIIVGLKFKYNTVVVEGAGPLLFQLSDVSTAYTTLVDGSGGIPAYDDLGSGADYGLQPVLPSEDFVAKEFSLNSNAIAAAAVTGTAPFVFGGSIIFPQLDDTEYVMGFSGDFATGLEVTTQAVPEPASMAVLGLGVAALKRRRRRA